MVYEDQIGLLVALAAGLVATGALAGLLAGLLGVGGGIVIVPVLYLLFDALAIPDTVSMHVAVGTSLATIIPTSIASARAHDRRGALDWTLLRSWGPFVVLGAASGGLASSLFDSAHLTAIFGVMALLVALNMALPGAPVMADSLPRTAALRAALGTGIGFLSSLMGIGGGTLSVPALTLFSVPVRRAVGTAAAFGLLIAAPATLGFVWSGWGVPDRPPLSLGHVNVPAAILIFSATVFTAPLGARIAHAVNPRTLKLAFAVFLALTAARMMSQVVLG